MPKPPEKARRRGTRIVPIAILAGAVAASAGVVPACQDDAASSDMGTSDLPYYPHDVSAHGFFDLSQPDLANPDDGGHGD